MMRRLWALAWGVVREGVRAQVFANLAVVSVFGLILAYVLDDLAVGTLGRVLLDIAGSVGSMVNALLCAVLTVRAVGAQDDRSALVTLLVRPVPRWQVLTGRYLGVVLLAWINAAALTLLTWTMVARTEEGVTGALRVGATLAMEGLVMPAVTVVFSVLSGTSVAVMLTIGMWAAGLAASEILAQAEKVGGSAGVLLRGLRSVVPDLAHMDLLQHPDNLRPALVLYCVAYVGAALALASALFARKDIR
jgi:ABC-type transport system involved in multi-copper enzyme maturation permease subunit